MHRPQESEKKFKKKMKLNLNCILNNLNKFVIYLCNQFQVKQCSNIVF